MRKIQVVARGKIEFDAFMGDLVLPYASEMHQLQTFQ
jgi:hypothetical protein